MKANFAAILIAFLLIANACSFGTRVNGGYIHSGMTDQDIVSVFGIDAKVATRKDVQGKDGKSVTYTSGEQEVTITRSTVSGVTVSARGPVAGLWPLDK
ncbi:MAG: hypothetical protein WBC19_04815 [Pyrinomonadaceae bacterium]|nr:hypothetical protein [Chloracidobacterium sp.]